MSDLEFRTFRLLFICLSLLTYKIHKIIYLVYVLNLYLLDEWFSSIPSTCTKQAIADRLVAALSA